MKIGDCSLYKIRNLERLESLSLKSRQCTVHSDCTDTFIVHYHQVGTGNAEGAGADEDEHRDQQHEEEVGVRGLGDEVSVLLDTDISLTSRSR